MAKIHDMLHTSIKDGVNNLVYWCHTKSKKAGWWDGVEQANVPTKLCLIHSEISEAMEGYRKDKMDDHLPTRKSIEVELADAFIRIADLAGYLGLDLEGAIIEKMAYNDKRKDHTKDARKAKGGKRF